MNLKNVKVRIVFSLLMTILVGQMFLVGFFWAVPNALALDKCGGNQCPPSPSEKGAYKLQINIPGVGERCEYELRGKSKICSYMPADKDLRYWIKDVYRFLIGVALAAAVLMMMVGGFQWILAMGNSGKIGGAKETIFSAVAGVIIALGSYTFLNILSPDLVTFKRLSVDPVGTIIASSKWCNQLPIKDANGNEFYVSSSKTDFSNKIILSNSGKRKQSVGNCGQEYYSIVKKGSNYTLVGDSSCYGTHCDKTGEVCIELKGGSVPVCINAKESCEETNKGYCSKMNSAVANTSEAQMSCVKRVDYLFALANPDECVWGQRFFCPSGTSRVDCLSGPKFDQGTGQGCWFVNDKKQATPAIYRDADGWDVISIITGGNFTVSGEEIYCTNDDYNNREANMLCCSKSNSGKTEFKLYHPDLKGIEKAYIADCGAIHKCELGLHLEGKYESKDALDHDPCNVCN